MDKDTLLTTYDNPFNPFTNFDRWFKEDLLLGHDCCGLLAKYAPTSIVFSDKKNEQIIQEGMEEIVKLYPTVYKIVTPADYE